MRGILDTSVIIATDVEPIARELAISAVTLAELHFDILITADQAVRAERLRRLSILNRRFDAPPVDEAVAASYGRLAATLTDIGRQPRARALDLVIAATAHAHSARLITRNIKDFAGLEDLLDVVAV